MRIAIAVPDPIYLLAERAARRLRMSRSQFYAQAVEAYLKKSSREGGTERLNAVHADEPPEPDAFLT